MAGFLQKFLQGAATAGAELYADKARTQMRDELMTARDEVLHKNRLSVQEKQQAFQTKSAETLDTQRVDAASTLATTQETKAAADHTRDLALQKARGVSGAKTPADVLKVAALVKSGRAKDEASAWDLVLNGANVPAKDIYKSLVDAQSDEFGAKLKKGDTGYMSVEEMTKEAKRIAGGKEKESPDAGIAKPTTQADFDALKSGDIYIDPDDGLQYRKP